MLSKAEILYLQGQKIVSKSYERKLKCLIKRKIDALRKEIPLLSKLLLDNSGKSEDIMYRIKEVGKMNSFDNHNSNNELNHQITDNQATKYSNINSGNTQSDSKKIAAQDDLQSSRDCGQRPNIEGATEFSNIRYNTPLATEFGSRSRLKEQNRSKKLPSGIKCLQEVTSGNVYHLEPNTGKLDVPEPKYYINNPSRLIKTAVGSGGVEVMNQSNHTVRLSISPSQGDDPGFKSRPEHPLF